MAHSPNGANRGHYRNARIDALTDQIRVEMNQEKRKALCSEAQKILAEDLPYCRCGSMTSFPRIAARSARSIFPRPATTTSSQRSIQTTTKRATRLLYKRNARLLQRLRDVRHGNRPFSPDSPGIAIQFNDG